MRELVLHEQTAAQLSSFAKRPSHALLLVGPSGAGKTSVAWKLAADLLATTEQAIHSYPYLRHITSPDRKAIGIETVRELEHFLSLKIPGNKPIARIAIIEDSHLLTIEAQNALLKTLEEPPQDTALLLTTAQEQALLPTIRSRLQTIAVRKPKLEDLKGHFVATVGPEELQQALAISGGLPGLTAALLEGDSDHPLKEAVQIARQLLQNSTYERLLLVDILSKRKDLSRDVCFVLMQMAQVALQRDGSTQKRWFTVLKAAYHAEEQLTMNAQIKLVLTNLMLSL